MGLFGGSKRTNTTTTNTLNQQVGFEGSGDGSISLVGDANRVSVTDLGAIEQATSLAVQTAEVLRDSVAETLGVARQAIEAGVGFGRTAYEYAGTVVEGYRGITERGLDEASRALEFAGEDQGDKVLQLAMVAVGAVAVVMLFRAKRNG